MKTIVQYDRSYLPYIFLGVGAIVKAIDHPSKNGVVKTSAVLRCLKDGAFETRHTFYIPQVQS